MREIPLFESCVTNGEPPTEQRKCSNTGTTESLAFSPTNKIGARCQAPTLTGALGCSRLSTNDFSGCDELIFGFRLTYVYWLVNRTQIAIPDFIPQPTSTCRTQVYYPLPSSFAPAHS